MRTDEPKALEEYTIRLRRYEDSDGWFVVTCDEVPGAITQGKDEEEALIMMADALSLMLGEEPQKPRPKQVLFIPRALLSKDEDTD